MRKWNAVAYFLVPPMSARITCQIFFCTYRTLRFLNKRNLQRFRIYFAPFWAFSANPACPARFGLELILRFIFPIADLTLSPSTERCVSLVGKSTDPLCPLGNVKLNYCSFDWAPLYLAMVRLGDIPKNWPLCRLQSNPGTFLGHHSL